MHAWNGVKFIPLTLSQENKGKVSCDESKQDRMLMLKVDKVLMLLLIHFFFPQIVVRSFNTKNVDGQDNVHSKFKASASNNSMEADKSSLLVFYRGWCTPHPRLSLRPWFVHRCGVGE